MNMIRFINELAANVGIGAGEKRFARDLARSLGFRVHEPEHGGRLTPSTTPPPAPAPTPEKAKPYQRLIRSRRGAWPDVGIQSSVSFRLAAACRMGR